MCRSWKTVFLRAVFQLNKTRIVMNFTTLALRNRSYLRHFLGVTQTSFARFFLTFLRLFSFQVFCHFYVCICRSHAGRHVPRPSSAVGDKCQCLTSSLLNVCEDNFIDFSSDCEGRNRDESQALQHWYQFICFWGCRGTPKIWPTNVSKFRVVTSKVR